MSDASAPARAAVGQTATGQTATGHTATGPNIAGRITELKVSGNLMTLDAGLFCLFQQPGLTPPPRDGSGLPGVRITLPPRVRAEGGAAQGQGQVTIKGLYEDGWLGPRDGAALVRVTGAPAQILITVYQSPDHPADTAPRLQVVPLASTEMALTTPAPAPARPAAAAPGIDKEILAHLQHTGDVGVDLGEWLGKPGSGNWIEGFSIIPRTVIAPEDIEYQAVLGKGWLSPWVSGGKFCGSRGMALPMLGFNLRLRGKAAEQFECTYRATFVDGTRVGPLAGGKSCEAASLSPLEAFQVILRPRGAARAPVKPAGGKPAAKVKPREAVKPAAKKAAPKKQAPTQVRKRGR